MAVYEPWPAQQRVGVGVLWFADVFTSRSAGFSQKKSGVIGGDLRRSSVVTGNDDAIL